MREVIQEATSGKSGKDKTNPGLKNFGLLSAGVFAGVLLSLGITALAQRSTEGRGPLPIDEIRQFTDVFGAIKNNYVEPVEDKKLITQAINGMLTGLDPHSAYLDEKAFKDLRDSTAGQFGGLGIEVGAEDGFIKVISPIEDTPAFRAGIKTGDLITKVDDVSIKGLSINDAVAKLRGAPKTKVVLTIARKDEAKPLVFTIIREIIKVQSVRAKTLEPGYGYVRISQFQDPTVEDLARKLDELYKAGALKGLVLDLRNDPGGVLNGAVGVAAAFLPKDSLIVSTKGQAADAQAKYFGVKDQYQRSPGEDILKRLPAAAKDVPMVVLINGGSASASEIVAGALQDYKRATLIGTQSFGKGSVQQILPLPPDRKTGIKLTISRYYTPSGNSIQAKGITPDYVVDETAEGNIFDFPREVDLEKHLSNDVQAEAEKRKADDDKKAAEEEKRRAAMKKPFDFGGPEDFQLKQAMNFLKGVPVETKKVVADAAAEDAKNVAAAKAQETPKTVVPAEKPAPSPVPKAAPKSNPKAVPKDKAI